MTMNLARPAGLEDVTWAAIEAHTRRLDRARRDDDLPLVIGTAKELVETIAKVVLDAHGQTVASNADLNAVLTSVHKVLDRLPARGAASDPPIRDIVQGAKTIIAQLPELRNRFGTGHGRVVSPQVDQELVLLVLDAAGLWSRWVLRRLDQTLASLPRSLVTMLHEGIFSRGVLRSRLQALDLPSLDEADQRLVGVAVAQRAMGGTFLVHDEGVDDCAAQPDLNKWPAGYRAGMVEGLLLDREGYVDVKVWGPTAVAMILAPHPEAETVLLDLSAKINEASWTTRFASNASERQQIVQAMRDAVPVLPAEPARQAWQQIIQRFQPDSFA